jgi:hypothetical protein
VSFVARFFVRKLPEPESLCFRFGGRRPSRTRSEANANLTASHHPPFLFPMTVCACCEQRPSAISRAIEHKLNKERILLGGYISAKQHYFVTLFGGVSLRDARPHWAVSQSSTSSPLLQPCTLGFPKAWARRNNSKAAVCELSYNSLRLHL